jgi:hypothetical protein
MYGNPPISHLRFAWHLTCGRGGGGATDYETIEAMRILGEWLKDRLVDAGEAFDAGRPAALAMVLGEIRGALVARDGNTPAIFTAIDRLGEAEKASMRGQLAAAREPFEAAAECIRELIRQGAAQSETATP